MTVHRFKPRYRALALGSAGIGGVLVVVSAAVGFVAVPLVSGALGMAAGIAYLASPTWKLTVTVDDAGLTVGSPKKQRFQLAWGDIVRVIASPTTNSCFVDGGKPEKSLLVPGVGAPAPYDVEDKATLVREILARVPVDKVETVETLEAYLRTPKPDAKPAT